MRNSLASVWISRGFKLIWRFVAETGLGPVTETLPPMQNAAPNDGCGVRDWCFRSKLDGHGHGLGPQEKVVDTHRPAAKLGKKSWTPTDLLRNWKKSWTPTDLLRNWSFIRRLNVPAACKSQAKIR
jgi:hypothetical protein